MGCKLIIIKVSRIDNDESNKELDDIPEYVTNDESSQILYVTKRGINVNLRKDLVDNYDLLQDRISYDISSNRSKNLLPKGN
jgi:hypothetical protein